MDLEIILRVLENLKLPQPEGSVVIRLINDKLEEAQRELVKESKKDNG